MIDQTVVTVRTLLAIGETKANIFTGQSLADMTGLEGNLFQCHYISNSNQDDTTEHVKVGPNKEPVQAGSHVGRESIDGYISTEYNIVASFVAQANQKITASVTAGAGATEHYARLIVQPIG